MKTLFILFIAILFSCQKTEMSEKDYTKKAKELADKFIIVDGHVDVPHQLAQGPRNMGGSDSTMNMDYVKAKEGGFNAPFMSIYVGSSHQAKGEGSKDKKTADAYDKANQLIDLVEKMVNENSSKYQIATSPNDIKEQFKKGLISLPMGMENGAPIEGDLEKLRILYKRGIRYITLTHSEWNHICDSSYDEDKHWGGLSPFGKTVVEEMNKLGIMVDISHVSDSTFYQTVRLTKAPLIASHSSCRNFTPGFERNMSDDMIQKLGENGGVIMINFGSSFVTEKANNYRKNVSAEYEKLISERNISKDDDETKKALRQEILEKMPYPYATVQEVADHIDHVVKLTSINHVGLGSDYDGVGDSLPIGLKTVADYPNLLAELLKRGYSEEDIEKICSKNVLRVWTEVEKVAASI
jgi:membrane dipeptidase